MKRLLSVMQSIRLNSNILTKYKLKKEPEVFRPFFLKDEPNNAGSSLYIQKSLAVSFYLLTLYPVQKR